VQRDSLLLGTATTHKKPSAAEPCDAHHRHQSRTMSLRQVEGKQFVEAFSEALEPRLRLTGEMSTLDKFKAFFEDRSLEKGTEVPLCNHSSS